MGAARLSSEKSGLKDRLSHKGGWTDMTSMQWFENHVYHVGKSVMLTAGRETPDEGQINQRCSHHSHRPCSNCLEGRKRAMKPTLGGGYRKKSSYVHFPSCHAPTLLQAEPTIIWWSTASAGWNTIKWILGDSNACVGSSNSSAVEEEDQWDNTRDPDGFADMKNVLLIPEWTHGFKRRMSTKATGNISSQKKWHCINYAIVPDELYHWLWNCLMPTTVRDRIVCFFQVDKH